MCTVLKKYAFLYGCGTVILLTFFISIVRLHYHVRREDVMTSIATNDFRRSIKGRQ